MSNLTFKNSHKENSETTVHTPTHEVCKHFQAQSYAYYSAKVKYRSQEEEAFLSAMVLRGLPSHTEWLYYIQDMVSSPRNMSDLTENEESRKYFEQLKEDPFPFCLIIQAEGMLKPFSVSVWSFPRGRQVGNVTLSFLTMNTWSLFISLQYFFLCFC